MHDVVVVELVGVLEQREFVTSGGTWVLEYFADRALPNFAILVRV